ncbi:putative chitinase [Rhodoligotrophos appendicifer]|uniref:glycoside hydrolase family 19 protein n=1 Tax=Rhodoligotrophos appendicifer TaxID=987056 RepID=UPI001478156F|nr:glycoside hydrolase family 19 protein [Rhodoligotrophos appendicifer]
MIYPTFEQLKCIAPQGDEAILQAVASKLPELGPRYGLDTMRQVIHFIAQAAHETDGFRVTREYASGEAYERRGDLGNTESGDGVRFKGRGIFMLTGRDNYGKMGEMIGRDLVSDPDQAADPAISVEIALCYWRSRSLNLLAEANDFIGVTRRINGGVNGFADRKLYFGRACEALGETDSLMPQIAGLLGPGDRGQAVMELQHLLNEKRGAGLDADGRYGPATVAAVKALEKELGLTIDGIGHPAVCEALAGLPEPAGPADPAEAYFLV